MRFCPAKVLEWRLARELLSQSLRGRTRDVSVGWMMAAKYVGRWAIRTVLRQPPVLAPIVRSGA